ncbi:MAG: holo-ACP synthase [Solirubrobacterales bacterium]
MAGASALSRTGAPGLGIDLCEIARIERALERYPRLRGRLFTRAELSYADRRRRPGRHLAARFAAKEATIKALGIRLPPGEVEVVGASGAPPVLRLRGEAARVAADAGFELSLSLTHTDRTAAAVVAAL